MKISSRAFAAFAHDTVMAALSFMLSFYLRVGNDIAHYPLKLLLTYDLAFAVTAAGVFWWAGLIAASGAMPRCPILRRC